MATLLIGWLNHKRVDINIHKRKEEKSAKRKFFSHFGVEENEKNDVSFKVLNQI